MPKTARFKPAHDDADLGGSEHIADVLGVLYRGGVPTHVDLRVGGATRMNVVVVDSLDAPPEGTNPLGALAVLSDRPPVVEGAPSFEDDPAFYTPVRVDYAPFSPATAGAST